MLFAPGESLIYPGSYLYRFPFELVIFIITAQRLRDFNWSGKWVFCLIPVVLFDLLFNLGISSLLVLIVLCAIPGTTGANQYGDDPTGDHSDRQKTDVIGISFDKRWFSWDIRRNRKSFILASVAITFLLMALFAGAAFISREAFGVVFILSLPFFAPLFSLVSQRFKDLNLSGWLTLIVFVTVVFDNYYKTLFSAGLFFILWAEPGTKGENKYGADPLSPQYEPVPASSS